MHIKKILMPLLGGKLSETALRLALRTARRFEAHLELLYVRPNPRDMLPYASFGVGSKMAQAVIDAAKQAADEQAQAARAVFDRVCSGTTRIPVVEQPGVADSASVAWREETGRESTVVTRHGRLSDLIVIAGPIDVKSPTVTVEAALRETGQPVLLFPRQAPKSIALNVGIGWNGSAEAARAVAAAMPSLTTADSVTVFTTEKRMGMPPNAKELCDYLAWHGVSAAVHLLDLHERTVGEAMLADAGSRSIDFLVLGAYSRRRMREILFGGVTQHVLASAQMPVLMAH